MPQTGCPATSELDLRRLQSAHDRLEHAVDVFEHLIVPESQHAVAVSFQIGAPLQFICRDFCMLAAVEFNNEAFLQAAEVNDV